eukprot:6480492-Alexandrium_andersonii.AAC.1
MKSHPAQCLLRPAQLGRRLAHSASGTQRSGVAQLLPGSRRELHTAAAALQNPPGCPESLKRSLNFEA